MAKQFISDQHGLLHLQWPGDCCLCKCEDKIAALEKEIKKLRELLLNRFESEE